MPVVEAERHGLIPVVRMNRHDDELEVVIFVGTGRGVSTKA
jgi:hypothetical protein